MKTRLITLLLLLSGLIGHAQKKGEYEVNLSQSTVKWAGKKIVGGNTEGTIAIKSGRMIIDKGGVKSGEFEMDTKSISSKTAPARLINHLKNEDFFDVEKYPVAFFKLTSVRVENGRSMVTGNITIKGITKSLTFPAIISTSGNKIEAKAEGVKIDRTQFGIQYSSGSIFTSLGDKAIEDNFVLDISIVAEAR